MRDKNLIGGFSLIVISYLFNIIETAYFGWNMEAQSVAEKFCDGIAAGVLIAGFMLLFGWSIGVTIVRYIPGVQIIVRKEGESSDEPRD